MNASLLEHLIIFWLNSVMFICAKIIILFYKRNTDRKFMNVK
jgi:hypothetical protein